MTWRLTGLFVLAVLLSGLAGCGRSGSPRPPGPPEAVTYPRSYPAPEPPLAAPPSPAPQR